jgi:hypothetical protein
MALAMELSAGFSLKCDFQSLYNPPALAGGRSVIQSIPSSIMRFGLDGLPSPVFSGGNTSFMRSHSLSSPK